MEHKINVLIFDDKVGNRYMLEVLLKGSGYAVYTADNGSDALKILKTEHIELVISDILMPVMDGFELCRKIRADKELCNIVFVVYTATYTGPQDEEFALKIGANLFIQKPCEPEIFMEAISNVLSASKGRVMDVSPHPQDEEVLKLYNERLVRELEQKMLQLEKEIRVRKNTEEILRQSQKMEVIGQLAGGIAHDFNNLLSVILGYSEIILEEMERENQHHGYIEQIYQAGIRAKALTQQLLAFSRKQVLEINKVDINKVVTGFEQLLCRIIGEDIRLKLSLHSKPLIVKADVNQLEQVLMNLAINARQAMPDSGALTIETSFVELDKTFIDIKSTVTPGPYVAITVSDTGCGIEKNIINRIFEPFFTTKDPEKGTGLGLATSYGIIQQHGGNISVYSEPGNGTVFKIYLPLFEELEESGYLPSQNTQQAMATATVLVAEDDLSIRNLVNRILTDRGYTVIVANTPDDAVAKASAYKSPIHLLLTDVVMPGMRGWEVFNKIRIFHPEARVLYMSGYTEHIKFHEKIKNDRAVFLQKPFTAKGLLKICEKVLSIKDSPDSQDL